MNLEIQLKNGKQLKINFKTPLTKYFLMLKINGIEFLKSSIYRAYIFIQFIDANLKFLQ